MSRAPQVDPSPSGGWLGRVERMGNRVPDAALIFVIMAVAVPVVSATLAATGWVMVHPVTGAEVSVINLLQPEYIRRMMTEAVPNFVSFPPLGAVLVVMIGLGVAERSGLIPVALRILVAGVSPRWLSGVLAFAGVMSSVAADAGFVVLPPLGAALFAAVGRHPVAGLCAAFAGVSAGHSANLLLTPLDALQAGLTQAAAALVEPSYVVAPTANYYFMSVSVFLATAFAWIVTDRVVEPRLGPWRPGVRVPDVADEGVSPRERKAAGWALVGLLVSVVIILAMVLPERGWLRSADGALAPFYRALVPLMALLFFVPGLIYGWLSGSITGATTVVSMTSSTIASLGGYIVLAFVAAQFIAYFESSNLGLMLGLGGAEAVQALGLGGAPLLFGVVVVSATINLFMVSANGKWALLAPVVVPLLMGLGYSPELAQAAFRVGDSATNVVTPLLPYFPMVIVFAQKYDPSIRLGTLVAAMLPYAAVFLVGWGAFLVLWFLMGWPLGPDVSLYYPSVP